MNKYIKPSYLGTDQYRITTTFINLHAFFFTNNTISNARLKLAKNQRNTKQHPEAELLLFENYSHSSSTLSSKDNGTYSKK